MAKAVDAHKRPVPQEGYVAERHQLIPELLMVYAPCGCYWAGGLGGVPFVTPCSTDGCDFQYVEVEFALAALEQAELRLKPKEKNVPSLVPTAAVPDSNNPTEASVTDMISEGGPVDEPLPEVPEIT